MLRTKANNGGGGEENFYNTLREEENVPCLLGGLEGHIPVGGNL